MTAWANRHSWKLLALLVTVHAALLGWAAVRNSVTVDEAAHVPAGVAYWRHGAFEIYAQSPPGLRLWMAWPALLAGAKAPPVEDFVGRGVFDRHWDYAEAFADANRDRFVRIFAAARVAAIALSCAGVVLVFVVARRLYGGAGGVAAATLWAMCPNAAAHGSIAGTDAGTAIAVLAGAAAWTWLAARPTAPRAALAGVALSAALLAKFSTLLLLPLLPLILLWGRLARGAGGRPLLLGGLGAAALAWLLLLAGYGFSGLFPRLGEFTFQSQSMQRVQQALPSGLRMPLPRAFVVGFDAQKRDGEVGAPAFFMGEEYRGTRPAYYPVAVLVKTPIATLLIVAAAGISMLRRRSRIDWRSGELPLLVTLLAFALGVAALATINIGVRYLLPAYPLAFVLAGRLWREPARDRRSRLESGRWVLLGVLVVEHATVAPRYLTFFNALSGGPIGGQAILNDSNADWGQGLVELRDWMHANRVDRAQLAYFGRVDPGLYGIAYTPANQPGRERYIAVSSYYRAGLAYRMPTPEGMGNWARLPIAEVLRRVEPVAVVGDAIWVYDRADIAAAMRGAPARESGTQPAPSR